METFLQYTILGLVTGGVYGIAASGLVVTYTTSGIFNFAHGAVAMLAAFTYWQLRFGWGWPAPLALVVVLGVLAPLLGALLYGVVMRGLRGTSEVTRIVVPVSVMLGFLALSHLGLGPDAPHAPPVPDVLRGRPHGQRRRRQPDLARGRRAGHGRRRGAGAAVPVLPHPHRAWPCGRWSTTPTCSSSTRGKPERLAMASWALGAFLAALAGVLITPIQGSAMSAKALTLLVIDAFAAAMFGRLRSVPRTFVGRPRARPGRQLRDRLLPGRRLDLDRQLPGLAADDRPVRRAAVPAPGPAAGHDRAAHPRALPHAERAARRPSRRWCWWPACGCCGASWRPPRSTAWPSA